MDAKTTALLNIAIQLSAKLTGSGTGITETKDLVLSAVSDLQAFQNIGDMENMDDAKITETVDSLFRAITGFGDIFQNISDAIGKLFHKETPVVVEAETPVATEVEAETPVETPVAETPVVTETVETVLPTEDATKPDAL